MCLVDGEHLTSVDFFGSSVAALAPTELELGVVCSLFLSKFFRNAVFAVAENVIQLFVMLLVFPH